MADRRLAGFSAKRLSSVGSFYNKIVFRRHLDRTDYFSTTSASEEQSQRVDTCHIFDPESPGSSLVVSARSVAPQKISQSEVWKSSKDQKNIAGEKCQPTW